MFVCGILYLFILLKYTGEVLTRSGDTVANDRVWGYGAPVAPVCLARIPASGLECDIHFGSSAYSTGWVRPRCHFCVRNMNPKWGHHQLTPTVGVKRWCPRFGVSFRPRKATPKYSPNGCSHSGLTRSGHFEMLGMQMTKLMAVTSVRDQTFVRGNC